MTSKEMKVGEVVAISVLLAVAVLLTMVMRSLFSTFCDNFQVNLAILCSLSHSEATIYVPTGKGRRVKEREGKGEEREGGDFWCSLPVSQNEIQWGSW